MHCIVSAQFVARTSKQKHGKQRGQYCLEWENIEIESTISIYLVLILDVCFIRFVFDLNRQRYFNGVLINLASCLFFYQGFVIGYGWGQVI